MGRTYTTSLVSGIDLVLDVETYGKLIENGGVAGVILGVKDLESILYAMWRAIVEVESDM